MKKKQYPIIVFLSLSHIDSMKQIKNLCHIHVDLKLFSSIFHDAIDLRLADNLTCYTSQLKYVFRLEENASCVVGQISLTP